MRPMHEVAALQRKGKPLRWRDLVGMESSDGVACRVGREPQDDGDLRGRRRLADRLAACRATAMANRLSIQRPRPSIEILIPAAFSFSEYRVLFRILGSSFSSGDPL